MVYYYNEYIFFTFLNTPSFFPLNVSLSHRNMHLYKGKKSKSIQTIQVQRLRLIFSKVTSVDDSLQQFAT